MVAMLLPTDPRSKGCGQGTEYQLREYSREPGVDNIGICTPICIYVNVCPRHARTPPTFLPALKPFPTAGLSSQLLFRLERIPPKLNGNFGQANPSRYE